MSFFNRHQPILRRKQINLDTQDLRGLIVWQWKINGKPIYSQLYTRIDQAVFLWGLIVGFIFMTPHSFPAFAWTHQAVLGSALSLIGVGGMAAFSWYWASVERLNWLVYLWGTLIFLGLAITNWGIFASVGNILMNLCAVWLALCSIGYGLMGLGVRSRTFLIASGLHIVTAVLLGVVPSYQFLVTAIVIAGTLFLLAEMQWDMRPPLISPALSPQQVAFNLQQHRLRASSEFR